MSPARHFQYSIYREENQWGSFPWECPNRQLKEINARNGRQRVRPTGTKACLLSSKAIISANKNVQNSLKILQLAWKASAAACQCRDVVAQVSVDAFYGEGVVFVVDIEDVLSRKDHIQIAAVSICTVPLRLRDRIHHRLDRWRGFVRAHSMTHNLSWFPAHHHHDVDILPGLCVGLALKKPVQFIQFCRLQMARGFPLFHIISRALFLSNSSHWTCSCHISFLPLVR